MIIHRRKIHILKSPLGRRRKIQLLKSPLRRLAYLGCNKYLICSISINIMCSPPPSKAFFLCYKVFLILDSCKGFSSYFLGLTSISDSTACKGLLVGRAFSIWLWEVFAFSILFSFSLPFSARAFSIGFFLLFPSI